MLETSVDHLKKLIGKIVHRINPVYKFAKWVNVKSLQTFVNNLDALCCVTVLVKGIAINCKQYLAGHAEIVHKYFVQLRIPG